MKSQSIGEKKVKNFVDQMRKREIDAVILTDSSGFTHFADISVADACIIPSDFPPVLVVQPLMENHVRNASWISDIRVYSPFRISYKTRHKTEKRVRVVVEIIKNLGLDEGKILVDKSHTSIALYGKLERMLDKAVFGDASPILNEVLAIKTPEEIKLIRIAAELADTGIEAALNGLEEGRRECEVAADAVYAMRKKGCERIFESIVSGYRTMFGGACSSRKKISRGEVVTIDLGPFYRNYNADICRTAVLGKTTSEKRKMFEIVLEAENRVIEAIKPGVRASEVDRVARDFIDKSGYLGGLLHHVGHPIGAFWYPGWGPMLTSDCDMILRENMTLAVEPAVCLPKRGIRLSNEDDVLITARGAEKITKFESKLFSI